LLPPVNLNSPASMAVTDIAASAILRPATTSLGT
jgi:hypothetical protein